MKIALPDISGQKTDYCLTGVPLPEAVLPSHPARIVYSAAHVVADPFTNNDPSGSPAIDWEKTLEFRSTLQV